MNHRTRARAVVPGLLATLSAILLTSWAGPARGDYTIASNFTAAGYVSSGSAIYVGDVFAPLGITNEAAAQEFTASATGYVTTIVASIDKFTPLTFPLIAKITQANGSVPGAVLASISLPPSQVATSVPAGTSLTTLDFTRANVQLSAGTSYFVTLSVDAAAAGDVRYRALLLATNANFFGFHPLYRYRALLLATNANFFGFHPLYSPDGGSTFRAETLANELGLNIQGSATPFAVPEPTSALSLALGGVLAVGATSRPRRRRDQD